MIADVSNKLIKQFAECLAAKIASEGAAVSPGAPTVAPTPPLPEPEPTPPPAAAPEPTPTPAAPTPAAPTPTVSPPATAPTQTPAPPVQQEGEPIDLLAVTGVKGVLRRAAPVLLVVTLLVIALIVWLVVR